MNIESIKKRGFFESADVLSENDLILLKNFVNDQIYKLPNKNFRLYEDSFVNSIISDKKFNFKIEKLISDIVKNNFNKYYNDKPNIYKVLRVVSGKNQKKQANLYHFDAHLVTLLIPILIPSNSNMKNGDLVLFPNLRRVHKRLILNILQKVFYQNVITRNLLKLNFVKKLLNHKVLKITPGKIYAFNGFSSLHGNLEIDPNSIRATLLIHAYDVFEDSNIVNMNRKIAIKKEIKNVQ